MRGCFYKIYTVAHAFEHVLSLLKVFSTVSSPSAHQLAFSYTEQIPWFLDSLLVLNDERRRRYMVLQETPIAILDVIVRLSSKFSDFAGIERALYHKAHVSMVLVCQDVLSQWPELQEEDETSETATFTLCLSLIALSDASTKYKPITRLIASQLYSLLDNLLPEPDTDLSVRMSPSIT